MSTLYLVATPIGNLEDFSPRAQRILGDVDVIAAEDTRRSRKLLTAFGIEGPHLVAYHEHNEKKQARALCDQLDEGKSIALVTDAGTPGISDPGYRLVREAIERGHDVVPIPGPNAALSLLGASGLPTDRFAFAGFVPPKEGARRKFFEELQAERGTILLHESPNRLEKTLHTIAEVLSPERRLAIGRELTKLHEEILRSTVGGFLESLAGKTLAGEIVLALEGDREKKPMPDQETVDAAIDDALHKQGMSVRDTSDMLAERFSMPRKKVYRRALERAGRQDPA